MFFYEGGSTLHNGGYGAACCQTSSIENGSWDLWCIVRVELSNFDDGSIEKRCGAIARHDASLKPNLYMF